MTGIELARKYEYAARRARKHGKSKAKCLPIRFNVREGKYMIAVIVDTE